MDSGNDRKIYELIVRHFLACCSRDALGQETTVEIDIAEEKASLLNYILFTLFYDHNQSMEIF